MKAKVAKRLNVAVEDQGSSKDKQHNEKNRHDCGNHAHNQKESRPKGKSVKIQLLNYPIIPRLIAAFM
jgi:hypothetical protein